jgi:hypothetical protein
MLPEQVTSREFREVSRLTENGQEFCHRLLSKCLLSVHKYHEQIMGSNDVQ